MLNQTECPSLACHTGDVYAGWVDAPFRAPPHVAEVELGFHLYYPLFLSNFLEKNWREQHNKYSDRIYFQWPSLILRCIDQQF